MHPVERLKYLKATVKLTLQKQSYPGYPIEPTPKEVLRLVEVLINIIEQMIEEDIIKVRD